MRIRNRQIGTASSTEERLLWEILKQVSYLVSQSGGNITTTTTTTTV